MIAKIEGREGGGGGGRVLQQLFYCILLMYKHKRNKKKQTDSLSQYTYGKLTSWSYARGFSGLGLLDMS